MTLSEAGTRDQPQRGRSLATTHEGTRPVECGPDHLWWCPGAIQATSTPVEPLPLSPVPPPVALNGSRQGVRGVIVGALRETDEREQVERVRHLAAVPPLAVEHDADPEPRPRLGTAGRLLLTFATMGLVGWAAVAVV